MRSISLGTNPARTDARRLEDEILRIRVRDYRVIYGLDEKEKRIVILKIERRSEATYREMKKLVERFKDQDTTMTSFAHIYKFFQK